MINIIIIQQYMNNHLSINNRKSISQSSRSHQYTPRKRLSQGKQVHTIHTGRYSIKSSNLPRYRSYHQKSKNSKNIEKNEQIQQQNERLYQKLAKILKRTKQKQRKFKMPKNNKLLPHTINIQKNQQSNKTIQTMLNLNQFFGNESYKNGHMPKIHNKINEENQIHSFKFQNNQTQKHQSKSGIKFPIIPLSTKNFQTLPIIWEEDPQYIYQIEDDVFTIRIVKKQDYFQFVVISKDTQYNSDVYNMNYSQFMSQYYRLKGDYSAMVKKLRLNPYGLVYQIDEEKCIGTLKSKLDNKNQKSTY